MASKILLAHETLDQLEEYRGKYILTEEEGKKYNILKEKLEHCKREICKTFQGKEVFSRILQSHSYAM